LVLRQLCDEQRLRRVRDEIIENIQATFKETDLFKVCSLVLSFRSLLPCFKLQMPIASVFVATLIGAANRRLEEYGWASVRAGNFA
jgi:hypothetical protein